MKRVLSLLVTVVVLGNSLFAQSVEDGRKFLYYERYKSAKDAFEKVIASNPNDINAVYWLGQTLIDSKANVNFKTKDGDTPIKAAQKGDQDDLIAILKTAGAKE